jgi:hypothetical protein
MEGSFLHLTGLLLIKYQKDFFEGVNLSIILVYALHLHRSGIMLAVILFFTLNFIMKLYARRNRTCATALILGARDAHVPVSPRPLE